MDFYAWSKVPGELLPQKDWKLFLEVDTHSPTWLRVFYTSYDFLKVS